MKASEPFFCLRWSAKNGDSAGPSKNGLLIVESIFSRFPCRNLQSNCHLNHSSDSPGILPHPDHIVRENAESAALTVSMTG